MAYKFLSGPTISPEDSFTTTYANLNAIGAFTPGEVISVISSTLGLQAFGFYKFDNGDGNVATAAGAPVGFLNSTLWDGVTVTSDFSYANSLENMGAGVSLSAVTDGYYAWFQTWGYYATLKTDTGDDVTAGDGLFWKTDNQFDRTATDTAPTNFPMAWATAADVDANDTVAGHIRILVR